MEKQLLEVDPRIWLLDDPRIISLEKKEITQTQFISLIKQEDPFEMRSGKLLFLSEEDMQKRVSEYIVSMKNNLKATGGLSGGFILDHKDKFLEVYPELASILRETQEIIDREKCKGCAHNKQTQKIQQTLMALPREPRNMTPLGEVLKTLPFAERWLTGQPFEVSDADIKAPPFFKNKKVIPLRKDRSSETVSSGNDYTPDRKQCIDCAKKHVAQALVLLREAEKGYPDHVELAYQHLLKAEKDVPEDKKLSFIKMRNILQDELKVLNLKTIHNITEARRLVEEYLKDPLDPAALRIWMAIGHLAEAEDEAVNDYPDLTADIRNERLALQADLKYSPALEFLLRKAVNTPVKNE